MISSTFAIVVCTICTMVGYVGGVLAERRYRSGIEDARNRALARIASLKAQRTK